MMKVKAAKDVHIRSGEARRNGNANLKGILHKGFSIEVVETKTDGEDIDGNSIWYKDKNGDWYWSGGFIDKKASSKDFLDGIVDYSREIILSKEIIGIGDNEVKIAILDTGINSHNDLRNSISFAHSFVDGESNNESDNGHATMMAGLIAGRSNSEHQGIVGLCPTAKLIDLKTSWNNGKTDSKALISALDFIIEDQDINPQILNLSFSISDFELVKSRVQRILAKNIIIVAAAGEQDIFKFDKVAQLARDSDMISVGAVSKAYLESSKSIYPKLLDIFFQNNEQWTISGTDSSGYVKEPGDSVYTALISGLIGRFISNGYTTQSAKTELMTTINSISSFTPDQLKPYKNE